MSKLTNDKWPILMYGIPCREIQGSGNRSYSLKDSKRTRILECAWESADQLAKYMIGYASGMMIVIPDFVPENPSIVCTNVDIVGCGKSSINKTGWIKYEWARLHCTYSSPDYRDFATSVQPDPITNKVETKLSETFHAAGELMRTKPDKYKWKATGKEVSQDVMFFMGSEEINITIHKIKKVDRTLIKAARNCVNSGIFRENAEGTVLFMGGDSTVNTNTDGSKSANVTLKFLQRDKIWNSLFNPESGEWEEVTPMIYKKFDFSSLLGMGGK